MTDTTSIQNTTAAKDISTRDDEHVDFGFNVFVYVVMFAIVYGLWALGGLPLAVFVLWLFLSASVCVAQEHTLRLQSVRELEHVKRARAAARATQGSAFKRFCGKSWTCTRSNKNQTLPQTTL